MKHCAWGVILAVVLIANAAAADTAAPAQDQPAVQAGSDELTEYYEPSPVAVVGAIAINVVYVPVRFLITVTGGFLGGFAGLLSGGNQKAAHKVWRLTDGSQVITPAMLEGYEEWTFSGYGW
jgi:hypothetical protein